MNKPFPRFTTEYRYVNRSGSLNDPDCPDALDCDDAEPLPDDGEDDYHARLDATAKKEKQT